MYTDDFNYILFNFLYDKIFIIENEKIQERNIPEVYYT